MEQARSATLHRAAPGSDETDSDLQSITNRKLTRSIDMRIARLQHSAICNRQSVIDTLQSTNRTSCPPNGDHAQKRRTISMFILILRRDAASIYCERTPHGVQCPPCQCHVLFLLALVN